MGAREDFPATKGDFTTGQRGAGRESGAAAAALVLRRPRLFAPASWSLSLQVPSPAGAETGLGGLATPPQPPQQGPCGIYEQRQIF